MATCATLPAPIPVEMLSYSILLNMHSSFLGRDYFGMENTFTNHSIMIFYSSSLKVFIAVVIKLETLVVIYSMGCGWVAATLSMGRTFIMSKELGCPVVSVLLYTTPPVRFDK